MDPDRDHSIAVRGATLTSAEPKVVRDLFADADGLGATALILRADGRAHPLSWAPICPGCGRRFPGLEPTDFRRDAAEAGDASDTTGYRGGGLTLAELLARPVGGVAALLDTVAPPGRSPDLLRGTLTRARVLHKRLRLIVDGQCRYSGRARSEMVGPVRMALAAAILGLTVGVTACSSGSSDTDSRPEATLTSGSAIAGPNAPPPQQPAQQCGGGPAVSAQPFWLSGARGTQLAAATVGGGPDVVVFVHESGTTGLCGFWPYAVWLAQRWHLRALLFDQCGYGASFCEKNSRTEPDDWITSTKAAVAWARSHGARRVTLVGASVGGIVVLHAAGSIKPAVDAVVDLSGELTWSALDSLTAARALTVPVLYAVAPDDEYVSVADMRRIYAATASHGKRLVQAESGHGWEMLTPPSRSGWSPLATQLAAIIQGRHG